jgi:hypothetical protein
MTRRWAAPGVAYNEIVSGLGAPRTLVVRTQP